MISSYKLIIYQLTRPVSYLFIQHRDKYIYDWVFPSVLLSLLAVGCYFLRADVVDVFHFVKELSGFFGSLPGFFIAALAAVATFNRVDIDKPMSGKNPPTVETLINTQYLDVTLSRRRFLCMLFSFLTMQSIFVSILGMVPSSFGFYADGILEVNFYFALSYLAIYFFMALQLLTATMHGMYYLGDRIHY